MIGAAYQSEELTFSVDPVPDTDSGSLLPLPSALRNILGDLLAFLIQSPADLHDTRRND